MPITVGNFGLPSSLQARLFKVQVALDPAHDKRLTLSLMTRLVSSISGKHFAGKMKREEDVWP